MDKIKKIMVEMKAAEANICLLFANSMDQAQKTLNSAFSIMQPIASFLRRSLQAFSL